MLRRIAPCVLGGVVGLVAACGSEAPRSGFDTTPEEDAGDPEPETALPEVDATAPPPVECKKMDIVFVIDNSPSMKEEQDNLAANFPGFIKVIDEYKTGAGDPLDYRIAITSTADAVDRGRFTTNIGLGNPGQECDPGPNEAKWLVRSHGALVDAGPDGGAADISGFFSCRARLGTLGSEVERPLEAARLSVTARIADGTNAMNGEPFLREDALLALVVISDEDEGGADGTLPTPTPIKDGPLYADDFDQVKAGLRGRWAAAVIAGDRGCQSALGAAGDAVRLKKFIITTGENGVFSSICDGDLTAGLHAALTTFTAACKAFPGIK